MTNKRILQFGRMVVIMAVVAGISAAALTNTAAAQGPGGGRGPNTAAGRGANGQGFQAQTQADQGCCMQNGPQGNQNQYGPNGYGRGGVGLQGQCCLQNLPAAVPGEVPADVVEAMEAGWLDEYYAYMTYEAIIDQFGAVRPFVNIQAAEQQHMAAHEAMFERYGLTLPEPAEIEVPAFATFADACAAAVQAEVANTDLYDQWLATVAGYPDLTQVFTNLRDASLNQHLPAFERCAG